MDTAFTNPLPAAKREETGSILGVDAASVYIRYTVYWDVVGIYSKRFLILRVCIEGNISCAIEIFGIGIHIGKEAGLRVCLLPDISKVEKGTSKHKKHRGVSFQAQVFGSGDTPFFLHQRESCGEGREVLNIQISWNCFSFSPKDLYINQEKNSQATS